MEKKLTEQNSRHARLRAKERYNLDFSLKDLGRIIFMIRSGQSTIKLINNIGEYRQVHSLKYMDHKIYPVYDEKSGLIVTFYSQKIINELEK
jgi:hypothetical protein